jgi:hypothetical protein
LSTPTTIQQISQPAPGVVQIDQTTTGDTYRSTATVRADESCLHVEQVSRTFGRYGQVTHLITVFKLGSKADRRALALALCPELAVEPVLHP